MISTMYPDLKRTLGVTELYVTKDAQFADMFVAAGLVPSRREYRQVKHLLKAYAQDNDEYVYLLVRRNKAGYVLKAKFCELQ